MFRNSSEVLRTAIGLWRFAVGVGHADELLAAVDPQAAYVLVEFGNPSRGWHDAPVLIGGEASPHVRRVRNLHFDLLVTGTELAALGALMRREHDGSLTCYQFKEKPRADFRLPDHEPARTHAMQGQGGAPAGAASSRRRVCSCPGLTPDLGHAG